MICAGRGGARTERKRIDLIVKEVEVVDVSRARWKVKNGWVNG